MDNIPKVASKIVASVVFRYFILALILISGVIVGLETYPKYNQEFAGILKLLDQIIIYVFLGEIILKLLAEGKRPWQYFTDPWNLFDFIIVAICFIPNIDTHFVMVLRLARILRVFRIISIFPKLQILVNALLKSIPSMGYVVILLSLIFYIYAVLGSFLFAHEDPVHFGSLHISMITLFKVLTLEGWADIMNIQLYGSDDLSLQTEMKPGALGVVVYFVSFILIGAMIVMNLFIGVIMNSMQESNQELGKILLKKQQSESGTAGLLADLEDKIDGLKSDIQKLNEILKK